MKASLVTLFALVPASASVGLQAQSVSTSQAVPCGMVRVWALPDGFAPELDSMGRVTDSVQLREYNTIRTRAVVNLLAIAAEWWCVGRGRYPETLGILVEASRPPRNSRCVVDEQAYYDMWGRPIYYAEQRNGGPPTIVSAGPDGMFTTSDDIRAATSLDSLTGTLDVRRVCG